VDPGWSVAVVVCANQRAPAHRRGSCGREAGQALRHWLRDRARAEGVRGDVVVHAGGCMDVCGSGTTVAVHAAGQPRRVFVVGSADVDREGLWQRVAEAIAAFPPER
jgi:predicted metal-binding protein